jgi:hypothetical protein
MGENAPVRRDRIIKRPYPFESFDPAHGQHVFVLPTLLQKRATSSFVRGAPTAASRRTLSRCLSSAALTGFGPVLARRPPQFMNGI